MRKYKIIPKDGDELMSNYTRIPNDFIDLLWPLTGEEMKFYIRLPGEESEEKRRVMLSMLAQTILGYETITVRLFNDEIEAKMKEIEAILNTTENYKKGD